MQMDERAQFTGQSGGFWRRMRKDPDEVLKLLAELKTKIEDIGVHSLEDLEAVMKEMTDAAIQMSLIAKGLEDEIVEEMRREEVQAALDEVESILEGEIDQLAWDIEPDAFGELEDVEKQIQNAMSAIQNPTGPAAEDIFKAMVNDQGQVVELDSTVMTIGKRKAGEAGGETGGGIEYDPERQVEGQVADEAADALLEQWMSGESD